MQHHTLQRSTQLQYVLLVCRKYSEERKVLMDGLRKLRMDQIVEASILEYMYCSIGRKVVLKFVTPAGVNIWIKG